MKDNIANEQVSDAADSTQLPASLQQAIDEANGKLPEEILNSIAISNAKSIGEQPAILANIALANQIFNTNLAQQNALANQQVMNQVIHAALAKCVETILAVDAKDPQAIENIKNIVKEFAKLINTQTAENISAQQEIFEQHLETLKAGIKTS